MQPNSPTRRLGYYIEKNDGTMDFIVIPKALSTEVYTEFICLTDVIFTLQPIVIAYEIAERNFSEIVDSQTLFALNLNGAMAQVSAAATQAIDGLVHVSQRVTNFLAGASAFVTQCQIRVAHTSGEDSPAFLQWNELRKDEHANKFAYRFLYEMRNFSQHRSLPISNFCISGARTTVGTPMDFSIDFTLSRDELLQSGYTWKKELASEIQTQDSDIPLTPLLEDYMQSMRKLCLAALNIHCEALANCARYLSKLQELSQMPEGGTPAIFVYPTNETSSPPTRHEQIPVQQLNYVLSRLDRLINSTSVVTG